MLALGKKKKNERKEHVRTSTDVISGHVTEIADRDINFRWKKPIGWSYSDLLHNAGLKSPFSNSCWADKSLDLPKKGICLSIFWKISEVSPKEVQVHAVVFNSVFDLQKHLQFWSVVTVKLSIACAGLSRHWFTAKVKRAVFQSKWKPFWNPKLTATNV